MYVRRLLGVFVAGLLVVSGCGDDAPTDTAGAPDAASGSARMSLVVDYSPTISDVTALLYLSQQRGVDLLGVTLAGTGESHCGSGVSNTRALLALAGAGQLPVACGPQQPVGPGHEWPPDWRAASDKLAGLSLLAIDEAADEEDAVDLLASLAAAGPEPITIVALGPLTNLALALERHPAFADDVAMIYTMGGALDVEGNAPGGEAEWNYYIDPVSVASVLKSRIPITMIPLDATDHVPVTEAWFGSLSDHQTTPAAAAVFDLHAEARPFDFGFFFWDELAAAVALDESLVTLEERSVSIKTAGASSGQTLDDPNGVVVRVAVDADRTSFEVELLSGLNAGAAPPAAPLTADAGAPDSATVSYLEAIAESAEMMNAGIELLFTTPEAVAFDALVAGDPTPLLDPDQEETARKFMRAFWVGATELMQDHRDVLVSAQVPENFTRNHEAVLSAINSLIDTRDNRLVTIDELSGEALLGFLWSSTPELDEFENACAEFQAGADASGVNIQVCPS